MKEKNEPVSNLDFGNQARIISHICGLVEKLGRTVIMTTHFRPWVFSRCKCIDAL